MIELELLGLHPDGNQLSLNDAQGNRYLLPITDSLRAALRKDTQQVETPAEELKPMSPREIQAHIRSGMSVADVCELSSLPASQVSAFAHPIFAEREYTTNRAQNFRLNRETGSMTLEELVISRLVPRGITATDITWDSTRNPGGPWVLTACYTEKGEEHRATWVINLRGQSVEATNDEATWLTETHIPTPTSPWRPLETSSKPALVPAADAVNEEYEPQPAMPKITALDAQPASAGTPSIDDVLASLDFQRGRVRQMPGEAFFDGAHPAASDTDSVRDATVVDISTRKASTPDKARSAESAPTSSTAPTADSADSPAHSLGKKALNRSKDSKRRRNRPSMPSWDEIVFGTPKE